MMEGSNSFENDESIFEILNSVEDHRKNDGLLFWTIENLSKLEMSDDEKELLKGHIHCFDYNSLDHDFNQENPANSSFYVLLKLIVAKAKVLESGLKEEKIEDHANFIDSLSSTIIYRLHDDFLSKRLGGEYPKDLFEEVLTDIAIDQPKLAKPISYLLRNWRDLVEDGGHNFYVALPLTFSQLENMAQFDPTEFNPREVQEQRALFEALKKLEEVIKPINPVLEHAWFNPVEYLVSLSSKTNFTVLQTRFILDKEAEDSEMPNFSLIHLKMLEEMGKVGYKKSAISSAIYIQPIADWLVKVNSSKSVDKITEEINEYMNQKGRGKISFRDSLSLPRKEEPPSVKIAIKFFENVFSIKEEQKMEIFAFSNSYNSDDKAIDEWVKKHENEKVFILMRGYDKLSTTPENGVFVDHLIGYPEYDEEDFNLDLAVGYESNVVSTKIGIGEDKSLVIPIRENKAIVEFVIAQEKLSGNDGTQPLLFATFDGHSVDRTHMLDAFLVTVESDDNGEEEEIEVEGPAVDIDSPLVSV